MIKGIFMDYTGTIVKSWCDELDELLERIADGCTIRDKDECLGIWADKSREYEENSYLETYINEDTICLKMLEYFVENYDLNENMTELEMLIKKFLSNPVIYEDVKEFFDTCPLPVYIISNNGEEYVKKAMTANELHPAGIISADHVRAYKPKREIFNEALIKSGLSSEEVIHIGDSYSTDYIGADPLGIKVILIDRDAKNEKEYVTAVKTLKDALNYI